MKTALSLSLQLSKLHKQIKASRTLRELSEWTRKILKCLNWVENLQNVNNSLIVVWHFPFDLKRRQRVMPCERRLSLKMKKSQANPTWHQVLLFELRVEREANKEIKIIILVNHFYYMLGIVWKLSHTENLVNNFEFVFDQFFNLGNAFEVHQHVQHLTWRNFRMFPI